MRVPKQWKADRVGSFYCGICTAVEIKQVRMENKELKEKLLQKVDKSVEEELQVKIKTYAEKLKENITETRTEMLERSRMMAVESMGDEWKKEVKKEVKENAAEERRKRRIIVFGMKEDGEDEETDVFFSSLSFSLLKLLIA